MNFKSYHIDRSKIPQAVFDIAERLKNNGFEAFLVGGAVRDIVFGREPKDYDILTNASCARIGEIFRNVVPYGITHGTVIVVKGGVPYDVTSYNEGDPVPGSLENDLAIRDFTINAMACDLFDLKLIDPFDGVKDFKNKKIKCVLSPEDRIAKDPLRLLRAVRQAAQFNFTIDEETLEIVKLRSEWILKPAPERVAAELIKLFECGDLSYSIDIFMNSGLAENILSRYFGVTDVLSKVLKSCHYKDFIGWFAKYETQKYDGLFKISVFMAYIMAFFNKNMTYKELVKDFLALKFSRNEAEIIAANILFLFDYTVLDHSSGSIIKSSAAACGINKEKINPAFKNPDGVLFDEQKFTAAFQYDDIDIKKKIVAACNITKRKNTCEAAFLAASEIFEIFGLSKLAEKFHGYSVKAGAMIENKVPMFIDDLKVNGEILMKKLVISKPGRLIGEMLNLCQNAVIHEPMFNDCQRLIEISRNYLISQNVKS